MKRPSWFLLVVGVLVVAGAAAASVEIWRWTHPAQTALDSARAKSFADANHDYARKDFTHAIATYEELARTVVNEELYYNLGNAYFNEADLGHAIYWYERALELDPGWKEARENLDSARDTARSNLKDVETVGTASDPWYMRLAARWTLDELTLVFLLTYVVLFGFLIALRYLTPGLIRTSLVVVTSFVLAGAMGSGALLADKIWISEKIHFAVTLPQKLPLRNGPHEDAAADRFAHAGQKVRVLDIDAEDWAKIRLQDGTEAYVKAPELGQL